MEKVVHKELSYKLTGLLFQTHKDLGCYRNEQQDGDCFENLLKQSNIKYVREYRFKDENENIDRCIVDF